MESMKDLTVIMMTPNKVPEKWAEYHKKELLKAIGDTSIITISKKPLNWGKNLIQKGYGMTNLFQQMLRGAKLATTPYIAIADDDTLYHRQHFEFRSPLDKFAYNLNRWHLFTWGRPYYFYKPRPGNGLMIAPRQLVINAIEARLNARKELTGALIKELGVNRQTKRFDKCDYIPFYTYFPVVSFYHEYSVDPLCQRHRKVATLVQAFDLPYWRKAKHLRKLFI